MSSRKAGGKGPYTNSDGSDASSKEKSVNGSSSQSNSANVHQLSGHMEDVWINPAEDGGWEVCARKSKNKCVSNTGRARVGTSNNAPRVWGNSEKKKEASGSWAQPTELKRQGGRGNSTASDGRGSESAYLAPSVKPPFVAPPLPSGWQWNTRNSSSSKPPQEESVVQQTEDSDDDNEFLEDSDDDSDDCNSDVSQKSHETRKKGSWFKTFFEVLDKLTVDQISESTRQWHCPACNNGPGAIDWYKGLQPLLTHAKTKKSGKAKLHREFADLLEEELVRKGTSAIPAGEILGKWKGLREMTTDHEIVWPPMVIVMNTKLDKDDNERWVGMGNQELLEYFRDYDAQKSKHSYGPRGHRGMSVLIFDASAVGYMEAERLHRHFAEQETDREAWYHRRMLFYPGGKRQLYGFLACKDDMDIFNQHCQSKTKLKFEMQSYQEKVVSELRQMSEDNQQLLFYRNQAATKDLENRTLEESLGVASQKLQEEREGHRILRERSYEQYKENKLEMDAQEDFYKDVIAKQHKATEEKEKQFERDLQEARAKAKQNDLSSGTMREESSKFLDSQVKDIKEYEAAREELMRVHEGKKTDMRHRHFEEGVELEKEFDTELTKLIAKFAPTTTFEASSS